MNRAALSALTAALVGLAAHGVGAQQQAAAGGAPAAVVNRSGAPADLDKIIRGFAARESDFRRALSEYAFTRDAVVQTIAFGGQISGEYHRVSRFLIDEQGNRMEKILFFPIPTLSAINITPEDLEGFGGVNAFALEASSLGEYNLTYVGKERVDELDLHVFDVTPKVLSDERRLKELKKAKKAGTHFQGRVWVDDRDLQIVKARGKQVPEFDQRFPTFETYREQIDGKFWFPTYVYADDELVFKNGNSVRVRMLIKYREYEHLRGKVRVIEEGAPGEEKKPEAQPAKPPAKP